MFCFNKDVRLISRCTHGDEFSTQQQDALKAVGVVSEELEACSLPPTHKQLIQ